MKLVTDIKKPSTVNIMWTYHESKKTTYPAHKKSTIFMPKQSCGGAQKKKIDHSLGLFGLTYPNEK